MKNESEASGSTLDGDGPYAKMVSLITSYWVGHIVRAAAGLSLADHLTRGPASALEIVRRDRGLVLGRIAPALWRCWRDLPIWATNAAGDTGGQRGFGRGLASRVELAGEPIRLCLNLILPGCGG